MGDFRGDVSPALQNGRGFPEVHVWILEKGIQDGPRAGLSGVPAARGGLCPMMDAGDPAEPGPPRRKFGSRHCCPEHVVMSCAPSRGSESPIPFPFCPGS